MLSSSYLPLLTVALLFSGSKPEPIVPEPAAPFSPRATIGHYNGNLGINTAQWSLLNGDIPAITVAAAPPAAIVFGPLVSVGANAKAVVSFNWGPVLNVGTCSGNPGVGIVYLRTTVINGPNVSIGLCTSELLMGGPILAQLQVPFVGPTLPVPPQPVPAAAIGSNWVSQVLMRGGTVSGAELSSAIYGTVDACF